jgi:hypothetical protein
MPRLGERQAYWIWLKSGGKLSEVTSPPAKTNSFKVQVFHQRFRERRIVREVGERDFRLDHPELGEVAAGVQVLCAERRPEGVDLGQRQAVGLDVELPRHRQERLAAEGILRENRPRPAVSSAGW